MTKKWPASLVAVAAILWFLGSWLEGLSNKAELELSAKIGKWKEDILALKTKPSESRLAYIAAGSSYAECDRHLFNFLFFLNNGLAEQAGEERDLSSKSCGAAHDLALIQSQSQNENERFYALYALGNINVRRAMLALSSEEQTAALKESINSYIEALRIKDDYEAKFNLELLISINKNARAAAGQKLSPDKFQLKPMPGAAPGRDGKSKL